MLQHKTLHSDVQTNARCNSLLRQYCRQQPCIMQALIHFNDLIMAELDLQIWQIFCSWLVLTMTDHQWAVHKTCCIP